jgi:16S rRNA (guanine(966)-N(2))-methyltransferase RsmD
LRVIAGSARGRKLHPPAGNRVRPTADRVKEALFSSLVSRFGSFDGLVVLDLFAGSGGLGIEALSRGAAKAVFVDSHPESITLARKNLLLTGFADAATLVMMDAGKALQRFATERKIYDIIFIDPPYKEIELTQRVLNMLADHGLLAPDGMAVFETESSFELTPPDSFHVTSRKVYGDTALSFFELQECIDLTPDS